MADTDWSAFTDSPPATGDIFLALRGAGGVNFTAAELAAFANAQAGNGSAATPGHSFASDLDTGMFRAGANLLGFATGGADRVRIENAAALRILSSSTAIETILSLDPGNVGFGTRDSQIRAGQSGTNQTYIDFYTSSAAVPAFAARIDRTGALLVGAQNAESSSGGVAKTQSTALVAYSANYAGNDANGPIIATMKSRAGAIVQADDIVGEVRFEGYGGSAYHRTAMIRAMVDGAPGSGDMPGRLLFMTTPDGSSTPSERMRIDSNGSVGIGTTSPTSKLHVAGFARIEGGASDSFQGATLRNNYGNGTRASTSYIEARNENDIATGSVFLTHEANGSSTFVVSLTPSGARTSDRRATKFSVDVNGAYAGADNVQSLGWSANRWSVVYAGTGSINTSDERAKDDISAIPDEWLDAWGAVEWVRYKFRDAVEAKGEAARWHVGLIAQRVRDVFAEQGLDAEAIGLLCYDQWEEEREPILEEGVTGQEEFVAGHEDVVVGQEMIVVGEENTGVLGPDGTPIFRAITEARDVVEQRPIMEMRDIVGMVDTGETRVTLEAGDRWGLRYDECQAIEAAWQRREISRGQAVAEKRIAALEALVANLTGN